MVSWVDNWQGKAARMLVTSRSTTSLPFSAGPGSVDERVAVGFPEGDKGAEHGAAHLEAAL